MKVLLAVDGSAHALRATRTFVDFAKRCTDTSAHVLNVQPHIPYVALLGGEQKLRVERWVQERGKEAMQGAWEMLTAAGVPFEVEVVAGEAEQAITRMAVERRCDLILMGTRGMGAITGMALGSVATKVVHLAHVPVMLVK